MFRNLAVFSLVLIAACGGDETATAVTDSAAAANKATAIAIKRDETMRDGIAGKTMDFSVMVGDF